MNKFKYLSDAEFAKELKTYAALRRVVDAPQEDKEIFREAARRLENSLNDQIELCCRDLPDGYEMNIVLERGAGWVQGSDPNSATYHSWDGADQTLAEQVKGLRESLIENKL